jgi:hypothetical protein
LNFAGTPLVMPAKAGIHDFAPLPAVRANKAKVYPQMTQINADKV